MVKVVRVGGSYWTVVRKGSGVGHGHGPFPPISRSNSMIMSHPHTHGAHASASSRSHSMASSASLPMSGHEHPNAHVRSSMSRPSHLDVVVGSSSSSPSGIMTPSLPMNVMGGAGGGFELDPWPRRRAIYHAREWLEWLGCEDAMVRDASSFV